jgi:hypothetical protein
MRNQILTVWKTCVGMIWGLGPAVRRHLQDGGQDDGQGGGLATLLGQRRRSALLAPLHRREADVVLLCQPNKCKRSAADAWHCPRTLNPLMSTCRLSDQCTRTKHHIIQKRSRDTRRNNINEQKQSASGADRCARRQGGCTRMMEGYRLLKSSSRV